MPSSEGENIRRRRGLAARVVRAAKLCAVVAVLSLIGLGDAAFGADAGALAAIAIQPAAARLLAGARLAPVVAWGAGFTLEARSIASKSSLFHATSRRMAARFPADAAGRVELGIAGEARRAFVRRVGAGGARGHLARGALVYDEAAPGIDSAWLARGDDVEELIVVREGAAAIAYDLELPEGSTLIAPPGFPGLVEVRDGRGSAWLRMTADAAWDARGRSVPIAVRVDGARVSIDVPEGAPRPVVVDPTWFGAGRMAFGRAGHTATLLGSGQVLIAGGRVDDDAKGRTAELYDPSTGRFTASATPMKAARAQHTATLLRSGRVLLVGGLTSASEERTAEIFDPTSASFLAASTTADGRAQHTATLLQDGRVLVAGGDTGTTPISAELHDDAGTVAPTIAVPTRRRARDTATRLADGRVLFVGGEGEAATSIEIFDPATASFASGDAPLAEPRAGHTATLLGDGHVLIVGGDAAAAPEPGVSASTAELLDPSGHDATTTLPLSVARASHTATLLPSGQVLLVGGKGPAGATAELFDPALQELTPTDPPQQPRFGGHTATLLPTGAVLIVGGYASDDDQVLSADAEIFDAPADEYPELAATMATPRVHHTATRLLSGKVLIVGGIVDEKPVSVAELYDRIADRFDPAGGESLSNRSDHTATLLSSGHVLIAGGVSSGGAVLGTASIYDPATRQFQPTRGEMQVRRTHHAAIPLPSGLVLITGGTDEEGRPTSLCELFDPDTRQFRAASGRMMTARALHSATRLPSGEVLIVGGTASFGAGTKVSDDNLGTAEIYDPITDDFHPTGALVGPLPPVGASTATLLPSGEVLILGDGTPELYDPVAGRFRVNVNASGFAPRLFGHTATLLVSGRVLIAGGEDKASSILSSPLIYLPASGEIVASSIGGLSRRTFASATLLASGEVLVAGGDKSQDTKLASARRWNEASNTEFRPQITHRKSTVIGGETIALGGDWGALGADTGGGSTSASTSNHPVAVWMPWTGGAVVGGISAWTPDTAAWTAPSAGFAGLGLLFISANGAASHGANLLILPAIACTSNLDCATGQACSAAGRCGDPVTTGLPASGCAVTTTAASGGSPAIALLLGFAVILIRRGGRAAPTSRCRAGRCWRRRPARRAPARLRA